MILSNGVIHTLDPDLPRVAALPITRDGRVAKGVEAWEGDGSQVSRERVDLDGRTVVPGLCDAHVHFLDWALATRLAPLHGCRSVADCVDVVARTAPASGGWLLGAGWRAGSFADGSTPTAAALDAVSGDRPAALWAHDRHSLWLNSAALAALDVTTATEPPPGGVIERDGDGRPTGVVREEAAWRLALPRPTPAEQLAAVAAGQRLAHARGATAVHDLQAPGGLSIWQALHADRRLTLRVLAGIRASRLGAALAVELRSGFGDERLQIGPVKAFMDGTVGSRTAWMLEPYADGGEGVAITTGAELAALAREAAGGGLAIAVHAIGDRAVREALDALESTRAAWAALPLPPRIEHVQLVHAADLGRLAALGIVASMQPSHAPSDRDVADAAWGERSRLAYAWRGLHDAGTELAFGSDAPIEELDPIAGLHAAVNRTADERPPWRPEQALEPGEALRAFTIGPARAAGWQERVGTLAPGMAADLVVLDGDPLACDPGRIGSLQVVATMVGGRFVHGRPPW